MNVGIIGLGLIGGSLAKAIKKNTGHIVYGLDINKKIVEAASANKSIDYELDSKNLAKCDMVIIALYPENVRSFFKENAGYFKKGSIIVDCAGVKSGICSELCAAGKENGVYFIGGHPMAGIENSGFEYSFPELFRGASMILCSDGIDDDDVLKTAEEFFLSIGFGETAVTTSAEHDKIIAFTSQLAHIASSAFIKSGTAKNHYGFSAGSFKDLTRVAKLNEDMWTELFMENRHNLVFEISGLIDRLEEYKEALESRNGGKLKKLLIDGKNAKINTERV